jgi:hypothetical protein
VSAAYAGSAGGRKCKRCVSVSSVRCSDECGHILKALELRSQGVGESAPRAARLERIHSAEQRLVATAAALGCVFVVLMVTLALGWRTRARRRRGLLPRWGLPRAPRRNFASWGEVRSRLHGRVARKVTIIVDPNGRDAPRER